MELTLLALCPRERRFVRPLASEPSVRTIERSAGRKPSGGPWPGSRFFRFDSFFGPIEVPAEVFVRFVTVF